MGCNAATLKRVEQNLVPKHGFVPTKNRVKARAAHSPKPAPAPTVSPRQALESPLLAPEVLEDIVLDVDACVTPAENKEGEALEAAGTGAAENKGAMLRRQKTITEKRKRRQSPQREGVDCESRLISTSSAPSANSGTTKTTSS